MTFLSMPKSPTTHLVRAVKTLAVLSAGLASHALYASADFSADALPEGFSVFKDALGDATVTKSLRSVSVSTTGPNRIAVKDRKIVNAIYDPTQFDLQTDAVTGQVFIFPKTEKEGSLFLTTDREETFALTLWPQDVASQEIILKATESPKPATYERKVSEAEIIKAPDFETAIKRLTVALARGEVPAGFTATNACGASCKEAFVGETLAGRTLIYRNETEKSVTLYEKYFYEKGVLAVAIEKPEVASRTSTRVYVISKPFALKP